MKNFVTDVKAHVSHSRNGKRELVRAHRLVVNAAVHRKHKERLEREIHALERQRAR